MTEQVHSSSVPNDESSPQDCGNTISPLPGEAGIPNVARRQPLNLSWKNISVIGLVVIMVAGMSGLYLYRYIDHNRDADKDKSLLRDRPSAAGAGTRQLDMTQPATPRVPALIPTPAEAADPIGLRNTGTATPAGPNALSPDDAPVLVVSSRPGDITGASGDTTQSSNDPAASTSKQLQDYQRRLQGLLDNLTQGNALPAGLGGSATESTPSPDIVSSLRSAAAGLFGGELQGSATPRVKATTLGDRSLTLPKGTAFTCALKTRVISATSGLVGCQVQRDVYSDNGRVLLVERGSHLDGEYRIASVRPGTVRIPVLWTRIRTPHGVTVDIESPGTGQLGESGIDGHVDNRWGDRIGAAMLLSLIDDSVKLVIQNQMQDRDADTIVLPSTTENTSKLAEKVLDSTINIPPLIYQNQGGIVGIYVARDVDFSSVYALQPVER
ncbi:MAG: type IV secretion system protein VirB10 [Hydrogenophaga sp.]|uniref:type IV secretion system protein VirB10 n=1 Tax=Hydrogenophaga sp. TaxID=1904254 RepID=UPI0025BA454B|nr:type IV secretion system protein VirB10 [Hydrogenophaga sp.]MBT9552979.1 type IV secretion system protein VirB10 [Hydrogenophaga sp.]